MVNLNPSGRIKDIKYYASQVFEDQVVDQNDTITCSEFLSTVNLAQALLVDNSNGSEIATTILNNVVTVSGAATDAECTLFVFGRRV
jgi:hypothetical protein